jgi:hypothetical protein
LVTIESVHPINCGKSTLAMDIFNPGDCFSTATQGRNDMNIMTKYALLMVVLMFMASVAAHAKEGRWQDDHDRYRNAPSRVDSDLVAPEVDPSLAIGGISLLAGGLTALRTRKASSH